MENENAIGEVIFDKNENNEMTHNEIWDDSLLIQHYDETMNIARRHLANKLTSVSSVTDSECSNSHRTELVNGYSHNKSHSSSNIKKKKKKKGRKKNEWHIGDPCRARYTDDAQVYEATIVGINNARGNCTVRYLGYNNHEEVAMSSLLKSKGEGARRRQVKEVAENINQSDDSSDESCAIGSEAPSDIDRASSTKNSNSASQQMPSRILHNIPTQSEQSFPHIPNLPPPPALGLVDGADSMTSEALHTMLMSWYMTGYHTGYYQGLTHGKNYNNHNKKSANRNYP